MLRLMLRALWHTLWGRLRHGPARPTWSWRFELVARFLKLWSAVVERLDPRDRRLAQERMVRPLPRRLAAALDRRRVAWRHLEAERFAPTAGGRPGAILYLHGGSFIGGSSRSYGDVLARLCLAARAVVYAPNYRLAPEYGYPIAIDDVVSAYQQLVDHGIAPGQIVLVGDSAGGNLALALLLRLRAAGRPLPAAAVLLSPWVDLTAAGGSMFEYATFDWAEPENFSAWAAHYAPREDLRQPLISPRFADLRGLPPLRVEVGTAEMLLDQVRAFVAQAREHGVTLDVVEHVDMVHDCYLLASKFVVCDRALGAVGEWIGQRLEGVAAD